MTKTCLRRGFALYLTLGLPLSVSCAREANTLEGDDTGGDEGGTRATTAGKGSNSTAGAGTLDKAGTTSSNAFGGTASTAGKPSTGGAATGGASGSAASGGKAGAGGASGSGGGSGGTSTGVSPDVLARASAIVYYETSHTTASDKIIQMKLFVENKSADPLPMANVKIRYWLTAEAATTLHQYYSAPQLLPTQAVFVDDSANSHVDMTFGGGSIVKGGDKSLSEVQLEIDSNTTAFNQADDFSWQPTSMTSQANDKITLYLSDKLVWGCEPGGKCFDDAETGGGGDGTGGGP